MSTRRSLLREMYLSGDSGQVERFDDLLHHDVIVHAPFGLSTVGLGAEKASWQQALAAMHDLRHELLAVLIDDEMESARCVVTGTLRRVVRRCSPSMLRKSVFLLRSEMTTHELPPTAICMPVVIVALLNSL